LETFSFILTLNTDRHRFQTLPASDIINLTSILGSIYMLGPMWKVSECDDDSIFTCRCLGLERREQTKLVFHNL